MRGGEVLEIGEVITLLMISGGTFSSFLMLVVSIVNLKKND